MLMIACFVFATASAPPPASAVINIDRDNVEITQSCTIKITAAPIADADNNGVIHIIADGITVDLANQKLHGAKSDQLPDSFTGVGVMITGKNVTLMGANISGFKIGIHALKADGLTIANCDVSGNFQQHLKSTPEAEDGSDWLWPHANDHQEWMNNYGAGICAEDCKGIALHDITAHHGQNGIILDRVNDSRLFDCDCSFLSGWGLALWRSNRNVISHNAFDFCVRGYSHGVYNRGQDSAGILMFEQCSQNTIAENSVTHGGDGFFGFAGKEALGEINPRPDIDWYKERGCNENLIYGNDFSDAVAHGLELTFSFRNRIMQNTMRNDAICGIWAGYSQQTLIRYNQFINDGDMGYGAERGGIGAEHGANNVIVLNTFTENPCAIRLWWDEDAGLTQLPWAKANGVLSHGYRILFNEFDQNQIAMQLQQSSETILHGNRGAFERGITPDIQADESSAKTISYDSSVEDPGPGPLVPGFGMSGTRKPIDARADLKGRERIIITEWGPYDWQAPYLQRIDHAGRQHTYRLLGKNAQLNERAIHVEGEADASVDHDRVVITPHVRGDGPDGGAVTPYTMSMEINGVHLVQRGTLIDALWHIEVFPYQTDPRQDLEAWHAQAKAGAIGFNAPALNLPYGNNGPSQLNLDAKVTAANLPKDHFGTMASTRLALPAGKWRIKTVSDDGIRLWLDDKLVIDDWTHHGPTPHDFESTLEQPKNVAIRVEHFELDGFAVLKVDVEPGS